MSLDHLYREVMLDHYHSPRNRGQIEGATVVVKLNSPSCGDEIALYLKVEDHAVKGIRFDGQGCSISQASASMMTEVVRGKSLSEALDLVSRFKGMMMGELMAEEADIGDLKSLQGVAKFPIRIKCALLSWEALSKGLQTDESRVTGDID